MDRRSLIREVLGEFYGGERTYPTPLPPELAEWHCYAADSGHNVLVILAANYRDEGDLTDNLCPAPVKAVLRAGYEVRRGYVVCSLPYSKQCGLLTDPADDER